MPFSQIKDQDVDGGMGDHEMKAEIDLFRNEI